MRPLRDRARQSVYRFLCTPRSAGPALVASFVLLRAPCARPAPPLASSITHARLDLEIENVIKYEIIQWGRSLWAYTVSARLIRVRRRRPDNKRSLMAVNRQNDVRRTRGKVSSEDYASLIAG